MITTNPDFYPTTFDSFSDFDSNEQKKFKQRTVRAVVCDLKENGQDGEWYPTTLEILDIIKRKIGTENKFVSILDCGAGNGSALMALTDGKKYAIEKSQILVNEMPPDIFVVGCDFWENSLIDKKVDFVFCNPPYSEYKEWAVKIINESNCKGVFLVIPERWKNQPEILAVIEDRKAEYKIIGNADFLEADRKARAKVEIIYINLRKEKGYYHRDSNQPDIDPFSLWAEKEFPINKRKVDSPEEQDNSFQQNINELVPARGLVPALVELYFRDMDVLQNNFKAISGMDRSIFTELGINFNSITDLLRNRISGLKSKYWRELFNHFDVITSRLTVESRKNLLETLTENISVDFNESNIYAVTLWAIKNANSYFDSQLIDTFMSLVNKVNLINYKSNIKTWGGDAWRFREEVRDGNVTHFGLDYRCVLTLHGTFSTYGYDRHDYPNGVSNRVHNLLNDLVTISNNLNFISTADSLRMEWEPGKENNFYMYDGDKHVIMMSVRAYKNGNLHIKFNQKLLRSLNVQFGRLKGWIRSPQEAAEELNIPEKEAKEYFKANFALECNSVKLLE